MNAQLNPILARQRAAELRHAGEQARVTREVRMRGRKLRLRNRITVESAPPPPPTPALSALDITPRMFALRGRRVGGRRQSPSRFNHGERPCIRRVATPATDGIAGQQQQTTFEITR